MGLEVNLRKPLIKGKSLKWMKINENGPYKILLEIGADD